MTEKIEDIAKSIQRHRELEIVISAANAAVGRSKVKYNGTEEQFWIVNKENDRGLKWQEDITGAKVGTQQGNKTTIDEDGRPIYKNTRLGEILIRFHEGVHKNKTPKGLIDLEIFNRATYKPSAFDVEFANDITIRISGDSKPYSFRTLVEILKKVESIQQEIEEEQEKLDAATEEEAKILVKKITEKEREKRAYLDKAQSFIRKYAELRYQPILDPQQESIKRSKIFDGTLIINGGPGTGKTTSLIQRIKFLTAPSIEEYKTLSQTQKDILFNQKTSWIFFSPNELLALFLRNSMKLEELIADADRVKVWISHKNELVKAYRLVNTETKRPFLFYNKFKGVSLFSKDAKSIKNIIEGLENAYLNFQKEKLNKVAEIDISPFKWKSFGQSIQNYIKRQTSINSIEELIRLFLNLTENFETETKSTSDSYSNLIKAIASRVR